MFVIQGKTLLNPRLDRLFVLLSNTKSVGDLGEDDPLFFGLLLPLVIPVDRFLNPVVKFFECAIVVLKLENLAIHLQNSFLGDAAEERCRAAAFHFNLCLLFFLILVVLIELFAPLFEISNQLIEVGLIDGRSSSDPILDFLV